MSAVSTLAGGVHRGVEDAGQDSRGVRAARTAEPQALVSGTAGPAVEITTELDARARRGEPPSPAKQELDRLHRGLKVRRYRSLLLHWLGRWFRAPRPVVPDPLAAVRAGEVAITFLGHASALLRYRGLTVAFDPMLGNWVGGVRRAVAPGLTAADLAGVDLILISHRHVDHLHPATLAAMPRRATVVVPAGAAAVVSPLGFARVIELRPGADFDFRGLQISTSPIEHGDDPLAAGLCFLLRGHGPSLFLCGDSAYHPGFAAIGARFAPDIALLPIGGFWPRGFRQRHMSPLDALAAFKDLSARALVPIHHGAFALSYEQLGEPMRLLLETATARQLRDYVVAMEPGQTDTFALEAEAAAGLTAGGHGVETLDTLGAARPETGSELAVRQDDERHRATRQDDDHGGSGGGGRGNGPLLARGR